LLHLAFGAKFAIVERTEMRNINRRESPRIDIKLRCHVTSPALWMRSALYTENISRSGLLVAWRGEGSALPMPSIGQILTIEVELPVNHGFGQKCIHCQGTVTRISQDPENPRVAMRVNYMDFRAFHDRLRMIDAQTPVVNSWMA
jgi:c-di-GMP-binding flagellar brake protein YcgR